MQKKRYAVQINNQEELKQYLQYCEKVNWVWATGEKPFEYLPDLGFPLYMGLQPLISAGRHYDYITKNNKLSRPFTIITLSQAKEKIRHMKAYKEWRGKQKPSFLVGGRLGGKKTWLDEIYKQEPNPNPAVVSEEANKKTILKKLENYTEAQEKKKDKQDEYLYIPDDKIYTSKIKASDKVWVELEVAYTEEPLVVVEGSKYMYFLAESIKKHIPVKSALEVAEEELERAVHPLVVHLNSSTKAIVEPYSKTLDRYYQARKTFEDLKGKE